ncbi:hypothetical protein DFQ27_002917 [Actinomortierella ambigua]|uniref:Uncharacterized protein n=1 Tax=Actinomortierella ambigua TaxID=1343610 RepID=A0A9P6QAN5_9FUNG|nr:hypothetical protein DFQ27_002917 [Actinomortierella ambigua]
MKFTPLLISAALAIIASAAPVSNVNVDATANLNGATRDVVKRCVDCTNTDTIALDLIIKSTADHYADIAVTRLDILNAEIQTAKVTSGNQELTQEKTALTVTVQTKIDAAKKACSSDELAPIIKATVSSDSSLDIAWSQKSREEIEKKLLQLDIVITRMILDRIQANVNADALSKECTEKMTNTEITPAPVDSGLNKDSSPPPSSGNPPASSGDSSNSGTPAPGPSTDTGSNTPAPGGAPDASTKAPDSSSGPQDSIKPDTPPSNTAPTTSEPPCDETKDAAAPQPGIDVVASVDSKYVCAKGCTDTEDAENVLTLRVTLENALAPRIDHVVNEEIPTDCNEKRGGLLDNIVDLINGLKVEVQANS